MPAVNSKKPTPRGRNGGRPKGPPTTRLQIRIAVEEIERIEKDRGSIPLAEYIIHATRSARLAGLAEVAPPWVPCAERMPRGDGDEWWVMVVTKRGEMAVAQQDWEQGHRRYFWHVARDYSFELSDVTHWRKLPEKPNDTGLT